MTWRRPGDKPLSGPIYIYAHSYTILDHRLLTHIWVTRPQLVNAWRAEQKATGEIFKCIFLWNRIVMLWVNFPGCSSYGSNWQWVSIFSGNGLPPNRCQAIAWINIDLVHRRMNSSPVLKWLSVLWTISKSHILKYVNGRLIYFYASMVTPFFRIEIIMFPG